VREIEGGGKETPARAAVSDRRGAQSGKYEGDMERVSEGRPRQERAEFIITSASSRYVAGKMAGGLKAGL